MTKVKVALFDFDNTIAHGDSVYKLQAYTLLHHPLSVFRYLKAALYAIPFALHLMPMERLKETILFPIDIMGTKELEHFYNTKVVPSYYDHMVKEMKKRQDEGCIVFLVTASSEAWMRFADLPMDVLMGTMTTQVNGRYTSKIIGDNCKGRHKVTRINAWLHDHDMEIDYDNSYGYSDSDSDIPMLGMVKHRYRVSTKDGALSAFVPKK